MHIEICKERESSSSVINAIETKAAVVLISTKRPSEMICSM